MNKKKAFFGEEVIKAVHLYGCANKDLFNRVQEIIGILTNHEELSDEDQHWSMEYWEED